MALPFDKCPICSQAYATCPHGGREVQRWQELREISRVVREEINKELQARYIGRCLSPPHELGCAPYDGKVVHLHSDGSWWFWDETWQDELGPYFTEAAAHTAVQEYAASL